MEIEETTREGEHVSKTVVLGEVAIKAKNADCFLLISLLDEELDLYAYNIPKNNIRELLLGILLEVFQNEKI